MSLRQKVRLQYEADGQPREVVAEYSAVDLRAWETTFKESALSSDMSVSMLTWLGHHAAVRHGLVNGDLKTYKAFDAVCMDVEGVRDEEVPTPAATDATMAADTPSIPGVASSVPSVSAPG